MVINMMTGRLTWMPSAQFVDTTVSCLLGVVDTGDLVDLQTISFRVVEGANQKQRPDHHVLAQPCGQRRATLRLQCHCF